jgi:hypothetical protein
MGQSIAILVGAVIIAAAIMATNHWSIRTPSEGVVTATRLNRWTGEIDVCLIDPQTMTNANNLRGAKVDCSK